MSRHCPCCRRNKLKVAYRRKRKDAKDRGLEFSLTFEEFRKIKLMDCIYCGISRHTTIDRIDNNKGYLIYNVVPACDTCNAFRNNHVSFIEMMEKNNKDPREALSKDPIFQQTMRVLNLL